MHPYPTLAMNLPFSGLGFRIRSFVARVLNRSRSALLQAFRITLLRGRPGRQSRTIIHKVFGYDLLVMQAREIRGQ